MGREFHMPHAFRAVHKARSSSPPPPTRAESLGSLASFNFDQTYPPPPSSAPSLATPHTAAVPSTEVSNSLPELVNTLQITPPLSRTVTNSGASLATGFSVESQTTNAPMPLPPHTYTQYYSGAYSGAYSGNDSGTSRKASATSSLTAGVDIYGFKKPNTPQFEAWSHKYQVYLAVRKTKWTRLLEASGLSNPENSVPVRFPPDSQRLRRYVRKGIPPSWRGNAWFWYAKGYDKLKTHPHLYANLCKESENLQTSDTEHIERDLHRTFPDNIYFRNDSVTGEESMHLKALRRVLTAFSIYQPKIGYCQSLNFIAGNLLLFMTEERAFWMLVIITQQHLPGLHEINLEQVNISQGILMISVRDRLPKIWNALNLEQSFEENFISSLPPVSLCTAPWFMSLMVNVLPTETMMRVWDCFFVEGPKTLFRISLAIFKLMEPQLLRASDELEVFQIIQAAPSTLYDPEVLLKACYKRQNGFGHLSNEDIQLLKTFVTSRRRADSEKSSDRKEYAKLHRGRRIKARLNLYR